jgi:hypothetical protein
MADVKPRKGIAILLGLGKPKAGQDGESAQPDSNTALKDAGDNLISAYKAGDAEGVAQAVLDIVEIGR